MCNQPRYNGEVVDLTISSPAPSVPQSDCEQGIIIQPQSIPHSTNCLVKLLDDVAARQVLSIRYPLFVPDHFTQLGGYGARWSCGYRNIQMICSSLFQVPDYRNVLFNGDGKMPTISDLQKYIEDAWAAGFDVEGAQQLGYKLQGTNKWIGTTECAALLRFFRIRAIVLDFASNSPHISNEVPVGNKRPNRDHYEAAAEPSKKTNRSPKRCPSVCNVAQRIGTWVSSYFSQSNPPLFPLYFQHQGHSLTIAGTEHGPAGQELLIFDPSASTQKILRALSDALHPTADAKNAYHAWRKDLMLPLHQIKSRDHQILVIEPGLIKDEEEYAAAKVLVGLRL